MSAPSSILVIRLSSLGDVLMTLPAVRAIRDAYPHPRTRLTWLVEGSVGELLSHQGFIDEVIMPHSTRRRVALGLRKLRTKRLENPWKKHDNLPL